MLASCPAQAKPLKVFILAGQSNIATFDYIGDDPATAPLLNIMRAADGKPSVSTLTWISYLTGNSEKNFDLHGPLTAGYHYLGCAKTFALMGKTFAEASLKMQKQPKAQ
jgi:alpha-galactosidase